MVNLDDLEWGDVIHQGDGLVVCEALLDGDDVVVKRWQQGILDDEVLARRLLQRAGIPARELVASGDGWMVLEDLSQSMWRPATQRDLANPRVVEALAGWLARVHELTPEGLSDAVDMALMEPNLLERAAAVGGLASSDLPRLRSWVDERLGARGGALVVGGLAPEDLWLVGDGLRVMSDGLQASHGGHPAEDVARALTTLGEQAGGFLSAYCRQAGVAAAELEEAIAAVRVRGVLVEWVASVLAGVRVDPKLAAQLQTAIVSCCCR